MKGLRKGAAVMASAGGQSSLIPRYPSLDGVRGFAALLVVVFHSSVILRSGVTSDPLIRALTLVISGFGDIAVAVFFSLSGFLLFKEFANDLIDRAGRKPLYRYSSRRFLRIYPAYWVALIGAELIIGPLVGARIGLFSLTARYSDSINFFPGLGVAWTLAVEVSFYVFLPVFSLTLGQFSRRMHTRNCRIALVTLLTLLLLAVPSLYQHFVIERFPADLRFHGFLFQYLDWFALGMLLSIAAVLVESGWQSNSVVFKIVTSRSINWPAAALLYAWATWIIGFDGSKVSISLSALDGSIAHACFGLAAFLFLIPLTVGTRASLQVGFFASRLMFEVGLVSYGVYLWHDTMLKWYLWNVKYQTGIGPFLAVLAVLIPVSLVIG
ncbi:MAG: hypothetical protein RL486_894, partial [Actinomycetota bacterium]